MALPSLLLAACVSVADFEWGNPSLQLLECMQVDLVGTVGVPCVQQRKD